jgi:hypothetical protein
MGLYYTSDIVHGIAQVNSDARKAKLVGFINQDDPAVRIGCMFRMVVKGVTTVAISNEEAGLAWLGYKAITEYICDVADAGGRANEDISDVSAYAVRFRTDMSEPDSFRNEPPTNRGHGQGEKDG